MTTNHLCAVRFRVGAPLVAGHETLYDARMPSRNPELWKQHRRRFYEKHRQKEIDRILARRREMIEWLRAYKATLKCERCPESTPICLDFHHAGDAKDTEVSRLVRSGVSRERIMAEIAKCIVLCANCHRKEHGLPAEPGQRLLSAGSEV